MGISDELGEVSEAAGRSHLIEIIRRLTDEDKAAFIKALNDWNVRPSVIVAVMKKHGFTVNPRRISDYRASPYKFNPDGSREPK